MTDRLKIRVKKKTTASSRRWLGRQLNDPYVKKARELGYRSRAAFKLLEIDDRFRILRRGMKVADIGAAPGGWSETAAAKVGAGNVAAIDILDMKPVAGVHFKRADMGSDEAKEFIVEKLGGGADAVLSDIAPNTTGNASADHLRIIALVEEAYAFALGILRPGGAFVAKVRQGGTEAALLSDMKKRFGTVKHFKPKSSRRESAETYVVATGFK